ncbi:uncharacterized protein JCM15063_001583 [Sporobolomyces koalae]|uniref:uncharacterized protein n=1 Tax=Sporobolomyces koalae TaxID=500713 RepID=UPI00316AF443
MFRLSLVSAAALLSIPAVYASVVSTSVFPNSACAHGLVGIGRVTLANGEVETHCGCPSDNLPEFTPCEVSAHGESVCNSVLNLDTGSFAASCGVVSCSGADCPTTVVNSVVVDQDDCFNSDKGAIGVVSIDGEAKCGCASDSNPADFTACAAPVNGRATCVAVDPDFLGMSFSHNEKVECGVVCDEGYFLTPGGACTKLAKREYASHSASHGPSHTSGPSGSPTTVPHHPHNAHTTTYGTTAPGSSPTTTTYSYKHHHPSHVHSGSPSPSSRPPFHDRPSASAPGSGSPATSRPIKAGPSHSSHHGSHHHHGSHGGSGGGDDYHHHHHTSAGHHHPSSRPAFEHRPTTTAPGGGSGSGPSPTTAPGGGSDEFPHSRGPTKVGPSASYGGPGKVGPSQVARRAAEEFVFSDVCAQDERTCPSGSFGDFSCVRLDDVTECGGCNTTNDAKNCLEIVGASSVACLRGGCVVRSCQTGFIQTSEGSCERVD